MIAFDMDGVLVDYPSSWTWIHKHFGVDNETALQEFIDGRIDDMEFMRRDIALWIARKNDLCRADIETILKPLPMSSGIAQTVSALKVAGMRTVIVSGGIDIVAERIASLYGFDGFVANGLEYDAGGRMTGEGILRVELVNKRRALDAFLRRWRVPRERTVCVGDSFIDASMFDGCGLAIAYNPIDDFVAMKADVIVRDSDLRAILPFVLGDRAIGGESQSL